MMSSPLRSFPKRCALVIAMILRGPGPADAQRPPEQLDAGQILHRMQKLGVLGSVLYLAAHPDDENTRLISTLSNGRQVRSAYLSLTRGDGGQNLIGPELGAGLGILRTQELLEARRIDGGEQFFTRAVDFGFSKSPEEALAKWGHQEVLADVVRVVRTFRPDVIVTRFATDGSGGHGHHTASALLASEAFDLAGDPRAFPEQMTEGLEPWQVKRLFFNGSTWWKPDLAEVAERDPEHWIAVDVGGFDPLLGTSYTELAGRSRSQHKSQGFGAAETRGESLEYLRLEKGVMGTAPDLLDGIDLSWSRVEGGAAVGALVQDLLTTYDPRRPEGSLARLMQLVRALEALDAAGGPARFWARHHAAAARELVLQVCGVVVEAGADQSFVARGASLTVQVGALQRRPGPPLELLRVVGPDSTVTDIGTVLPWNRPVSTSVALVAAPDSALDEPYWLAAPHGTLYAVSGGHQGVEAASRASTSFRVTLRLPDGQELTVERPVMQTWVDRVAGQRARAVGVAPVASLEPVDGVALARGERVVVEIDVEALSDDLDGELEVALPAGWSMDQPAAPIAHLARGARQRLRIGLRHAPEASAGWLRLALTGSKGRADRTRHVIDYPHILPQVWYSPAEVRLVPLDVAVSVKTVGFIDGVGDGMPRALARLGIAVEHIDPATADAVDLARYDTIVTGIRAYNTVPALARFQSLLLDHVEAGGTLLVQYNTAGRDLVVDGGVLGPHPFQLTRSRVTVEEAPPTLLAPEHPLLCTPNRIGAADFEGWVQERGLYFAGDLDPSYTALIAWNDPGEASLNGALITCDHGKGRFVYTGISLFRQLPAGVPGAYRLLANLLARRAVGE